MTDEQQAAYILADVNVDPCDFVMATLSITASWEGDPEATAKEAVGMISAVELHCPCGHVQSVRLEDATPVARAMEDFNHGLKKRQRPAGPKRLSAHEKRKLKGMLRDALGEAARMPANSQVCARCRKEHSL